MEAGLAWLARHAADDGTWDADGFPARCETKGPACDGLGRGQHGEDVPCPFDAPISALATLAFLGAGHGPWVEGDAYGPLVERALAALRGVGDMWGLPLATQALAEAEVLEGRGRFVESVRANAARLLDARQPDGAWAYAAGFRAGADVPYTALVVPALVAARDVGVELPATLAADVDRWLASLEDDAGRLAYLADGRRYGYTPTSANGLAAAALRGWLEVARDGKRHRGHLALAAKRPARLDDRVEGAHGAGPRQGEGAGRASIALGVVPRHRGDVPGRRRGVERMVRAAARGARCSRTRSRPAARAARGTRSAPTSARPAAACSRRRSPC